MKPLRSQLVTAALVVAAHVKGAVLSSMVWLVSAAAMVAILTIGVNAGFAQTTRTGTVGGQGGGPFELACPAGTVMTGLNARHGSWIDALAPICSVWVRSSETLGEIDDQPFAGGNGGGPAFIRCEGRRGVVTGIDMSQADNTDRSIGAISVFCGDYKEPERRSLNRLGGSADYLGQYSGAAGGEHCERGMVAAGIFGKSGAFIDRLGLLCVRSTALATGPSPEGKVLGRRVPGAPGPAGPPRSICDSARDARARNSPAAPNLEAQCRAASVIVARIAVLRSNGEALVKQGGLSTGWITEHTDVIQMALSGNRIAVLRKDGEALVKEGHLSAGWITEHTDVVQVALSGNRIAVLRKNGEALVKEGSLSAGWITEHTDVVQVALSGNRIAVLRKNGEALVKEGSLSAGWITEHTDVIQVALSGTRIAVLRANGEALVKEGSLSAGWTTVHTQVTQVALSGTRIAVLRANGEALVKEGDLSAGWITEHTDVIQVALSGNRIAVLRKNGEALVKEGDLSAGWITEHTDVVQVALSGNP